MDLDKLPVSTYRVQTVDKKAIEKDRKDWWDKFFTKYEDLGQECLEEEEIHEIDQPIRVARRCETFRDLEGDIPSSKTFRRWVREHEDEIDELTTIAGPLGEDEEEIGEEFDEDEPSSDEDETIDDEDETGHEEVPGHQEDSPTSVSSPSKFFAEDEESDSDIEVTGVTYIAKDLKITNKSLTPGKLHSPRKLKSPNKNSTVFAEDDDSDSDSDIEITGVTYIPKSLKITNKLLTPVKKNSPMKPKTLVENTSLSTPSKNRSFLTPSKNTSFREKFMSPKVSSSIGNKSLLTPKKNESSLLNLTCESCGNDTEYSINMGVQEEEEKFQCDECMLAIHPDCEEECSVCRHTAEKVEARWALKDIFLENSRNGNPNTSSAELLD